MTGKETEYRSGLLMLPSYLAKGLEFDVVIIANADSRNYRENDEEERCTFLEEVWPRYFDFQYFIHENLNDLLKL